MPALGRFALKNPDHITKNEDRHRRDMAPGQRTSDLGETLIKKRNEQCASRFLPRAF